MVVDEEVAEYESKPLSESGRISLLKKEFDRANIVRDVRVCRFLNLSLAKFFGLGSIPWYRTLATVFCLYKTNIPLIAS